MKALSIYLYFLINMLFVNFSFGQSDIKSGPIIVFEKINHDYGVIDSASNGSYVFKFKNEGNRDLYIYEAKGSCGCTLTDWTKTPIVPGGYGEIKILYDTKKIGYINKSVFVLTNSTNYEQGSVTLRIKGEVVRKQK